MGEYQKKIRLRIAGWTESPPAELQEYFASRLYQVTRLPLADMVHADFDVGIIHLIDNSGITVLNRIKENGDDDRIILIAHPDQGRTLSQLWGRHQVLFWPAEARYLKAMVYALIVGKSRKWEKRKFQSKYTKTQVVRV